MIIRYSLFEKVVNEGKIGKIIPGGATNDN